MPRNGKVPYYDSVAPVGAHQVRVLADLLAAHPGPVRARDLHPHFGHVRQPAASVSHTMRALIARGLVWRSVGTFQGLQVVRYGIADDHFDAVVRLVADTETTNTNPISTTDSKES